MLFNICSLPKQISFWIKNLVQYGTDVDLGFCFGLVLVLGVNNSTEFDKKLC